LIKLFKTYGLSKLKILFTALGLWALVFAVSFYFASRSEENATLNKSVQFNVSQVNKVSQEDLVNVANKTRLNVRGSFVGYSLTSNFPYCIYKNNSLVYWSNHKFIPKIESLKGNSQVLLTDKKSNKLLNIKRVSQKGDIFYICSIIELNTSFDQDNDYLKNSYNKNIFPKKPKRIWPKSSAGADGLVFGVDFDQTNERSLVYVSDFFSFFLPFLLLLGFSMFMPVFLNLVNSKRYLYASGILFGFLFFMRIVMFLSNIPLDFFELRDLNYRADTADILDISFIDKIINSFFIFIWIILSVLFFLRRGTIKLQRISETNKTLVSVLTVVLFVLAIHYFALEVKLLVETDFFGINDLLNISFNKVQVLSIIYLLLIFGIFLSITQVYVFVFMVMQGKNRSSFFHWLYGFLFATILFYYLHGFSWICVIAGVYFYVLFYFKFPVHFFKPNFRTLIYFILNAIFFSFMAVYITQGVMGAKNSENRESFGERYLSENDIIGEGLLQKLKEEIKINAEIKSALLRDSFSDEIINQIIKDKLLNVYFDKYETEIFSFNSNGFSLAEDGYEIGLDTIKAIQNDPAFSTKLQNIYLLNRNGSKVYIAIQEIETETEKLGTIVIRLISRENQGSYVIPNLLLDKKYIQNPESKNYSYAIFGKNNKLIESDGKFVYDSSFPLLNIPDSALYNGGMIFKDYIHQAVRGANNNIIIVSEESKIFKNGLSNFSFLFLIFVTGISLVLILTTFLYNGSKAKMLNFSTKIQLYLNAALLLPLLLLLIITLSLIRSTLVDIQDKALLDNTKNISSTVQILIDDYRNGKSSQAYFEAELNALANTQKIDLNLYSIGGKLTYSSRPLLHQTKLLSDYMNPSALMTIMGRKQNEVLKNETLGELNYKSVYIGLNDKLKKQIGIVGIPFFDTKTNLDREIKEVVSVLLVIFMFMFLILLLSSFLASNNLTHPLKIISQKIKRTKLENANEAIEWDSNDEIGVLTKSYNKMIKKLEESKQALSQSEKQTAWREMAKQVAHEIKNPLTPMKLSIQQLQRTLPNDDPKVKERIQRALNSLTDQIDTISEIANSFSEFAKMPVPKTERFDMVATVQKTVDLYMQANNVNIEWECNESTIFVSGDRLFFSRVITNLILNGIQAVPPVRQASIRVKVYKEAKNGIVSITDNGSGIPEDIRKKVFITNFSTKVGGSGLGLAMAKKGIEHAGGNIWFETVEDEGTTFYVDLPSVE
jgi:two-component system, NtrC family, nitrogen regulation sensor histidine kinase NtrY